MTSIRLLFGLVLIAVASPCLKAETEWRPVQVPGTWESQDSAWRQLDGFVWYRCGVQIPATWQGRPITLVSEKIDDVCQFFWNGKHLGGHGTLPPQFQTASETSGELMVPTELAAAGEVAELYLRIFDQGGAGGFKGEGPYLRCGKEMMPLLGAWQMAVGDRDLSAEHGPIPPEVIFASVVEMEAWQGARQKEQERRRLEQLAKQNGRPAFRTGGLSPAESAQQFIIRPGLVWEQVLTEPDIAQPLFVTFDARGRLWLVEYRQYPHPAGLKIVSRDNFWRNVYDQVPPPPPHNVGPFRGADRITIHEDKDGDGTFEHHKVFVDGLNMATSVAHGRGGVWVLNPPYLLFYPDHDGDDRPDADPVVHLQGFGLEDSHSIANNLTWGPDGWLYGAQGSTVTGQMLRPGIDSKPIVTTMGQLIWRYHPETRQFEVFAEGGGNAFGVEIDSQGRVFSGHNGGNTRGFHYVQGGYYQKGFTKHGPLSNPFAYGYFPAIKHPDVERFTHAFIIYDGDALPNAFRGVLLGVEPLQGRVVMSRVSPLGSTFETHDLEFPVQSRDNWFRPVHITQGPDGAVYVCDWYDGQVNHYRNHEGQCDPTNGRIYRLRSADIAPAKIVNWEEQSSHDLIHHLASPSKHVRATVRSVLADRRDRSIVAELQLRMKEKPNQEALEALWSLNASGGLNGEVIQQALSHAYPYVRAWGIRLATDQQLVDTDIAQTLMVLATDETHPAVRSQLACSARRLPASSGLPILGKMMEGDRDLTDPHIPLLVWWGLETHLRRDAQPVIALWGSPSLGRSELCRKEILPRMARRWGEMGRAESLELVAQLLQKCREAGAIGVGDERAGGNQTALHAAQPVLDGLEQGLAQRDAVIFPPSLLQQLARLGGGSLTLRLRQGDERALEEALRLASDSASPVEQRLLWLNRIGERPHARAYSALIAQLKDTTQPQLQQALMTALEAYDEPTTADVVLALWERLEANSQLTALNLLATRVTWARKLVAQIAAEQLATDQVPSAVVQSLRALPDSDLHAQVDKWWPQNAQSQAELEAKIGETLQVVNAGHGSPYEGKKLFLQQCGKCHRLFEQGGEIGPDLTPFGRSNVELLTLNIVNPNAEIREGFEHIQVIGTDGRSVSGFIQDSGSETILLKRPDGVSVTLARSEIETMRPAGHSVMPSGLLDPLSPQQVRDLYAYLRSTQPLSE